MPKGSSRSGPPPDPSALRRERDANEWLHLPNAGRLLPPPVWPLPYFTLRERVLWDLLWAKPQALVWEAYGQELEVALFVRSFRGAERPTATTPTRTLVAQQMDRLGLTITGLRYNRWIIDDQVAEPLKTVGRSGPSARARLQALKAG